MSEKYEIQLGVGLNEAELNTVKKILQSIEDQKRDVVYNVDFNIKNIGKLTKVGSEIEKIQDQLNNMGSSKKVNAAIPIDSKQIETTLNKIHDSLKKLQNAFGRIDKNKGVQSLLTTVNKIGKSLETVSKQFEGLNKNLTSLTAKDFSLNFDFGIGNSSKNPEQAMKELKMLKKEIEEYQKYFSKLYSLNGKNTDPINRLMLQHNQRNQVYMMQLQQSMNKGSDAQRIAAAKEYIKVIKETAKAANIALEPVEFKLAESSEFIRVRNEASETEKQLKELFSGGIDAAKLHQDLTNIAEDLRKIQEFISNVSNEDHIDGLTQSFNKLSETLEKLSGNLVSVKNKLDTVSNSTSGGLAASAVSDIASVTDKIEKESAASTAAVIENEKKKQEAYKATADTVLYHAGIVSKLNKAETNGRFYGSNRGTGYFGTGHYFVDSATKHELDNSSYSKLPYTSVDISQYDNLFRVTSDEVGYALHSFLANLTRFTQGSDDFSVDELFSQFRNVFGDTIMDIKEFGSKLDQLKTFMSSSNFYDRSDSVSTQFMKSLGYGGVDTRGTSLADTRYGTVIYDLKEESILQANITDELQKQGQMLEKINYEKGQVFDKESDEKILKQLDEQAKRKEIADEYESTFDTSNFDKADADLTNAKNRLRELDEAISQLQYSLNNLDKEYREYVNDMSDFGFDDDLWLLEDEDEWKKTHSEIYQDSINELSKEKAELQSKIPVLEEAYNMEAQLSQEAYEQAKQVIEQRHLEAQQAQETANAVVQSEERKQQALEQTADTAESTAQRASQAGKLISDSAQKAIDNVSSQSIDRAFTVDEDGSIAFRREMENLVSQWTDAKGKLTDIKINTETFFDGDTGRSIEKITSAIVTYNNGLDETIKKTIALRQIGTKVDVVDGAEMTSPVFGFVEVSGQYSKSLGKTKAQTDAFVKQQKQVVANLTNQINQLNRAASDQNASRPIKDSSHLDTLKSKYNEIISAIQRLGSASTDTFVDEQNNVKALISDFKSLLSEYRNAENVSNKMKGTDFASGLAIAKNDLAKFEAEVKDLPQMAKTIQELNTAISGVGDASTLNKFNNQLRVARSELAKIKSETSDDKFAKDIEIKLNAGKFSTKVEEVRTDISRLSNASDILQQKFELLVSAETSMNSAFKSGTVKEQINAYKKYQFALESVENQLKENKIAEQNANNLSKLNQKKEAFSLEMRNWLKDNSAAANQFGARIKDLMAQIDACDDAGLGNLRREFQNVKKEAQLAGKATKTVGDRIKEQFAQYSTYLGVAELFMWAEQGLRDMFEQVKVIDSAMTELKKVTNETDAVYNQFLSNTGSRAKEIGTTIDGLVSSTADFARLGYDFADAQGLAEVANIYAVVGDDIDSVEAATQSLISTLTAFKDEAGDLSESEFALSIVDKMNEVANNFAISSGGIGDALQRSASSMMAANNSLDETIALITAANTVVQDPDSVGRLMPT